MTILDESPVQLLEEAEYPPANYKKVYELSEIINFNTSTIVTAFSELSFSEEDNALIIDQRNTQYVFTLDDLTKRILARIFKINVNYLTNCPDDLAIYNLQYWLDHQESDTELEVEFATSRLHHDRYDIISIRPSNVNYVSIPAILETFLSVFSDEDEIVSFDRTENSASLTVKTESKQVEVLGDGSANRPKVGDITHGGLRIFVSNSGKPSVKISPYTHRLVCLNGMTTEDHVDFNLKGTTAEELITEVNEIANTLMDNIDMLLCKYADTANVPVSGNIQLLLTHLAHEYKLGDRVLARFLDKSKHVPENASVYDIIQIFTSTANETNSVGTRNLLQSLGGNFAANTQLLTSRCNECEQLVM